MSASEVKWVRLGECIELSDERNTEEKYTLDDVRGISTEKKFIPTKANMEGVSLKSYKVVHPYEFSYVADTSRRGDKIALALNNAEKTVLISSIYTTFRCKDNEQLLPDYLFLLFSRPEFDRYSRFNSWGSARETFDWDEFCRILIPLPSISTQRKLVAAYNGLKALAEQNETLANTLAKMCEAHVVEAGKKYPQVAVGEFIEECDERNTDLSISLSMGISNNKQFQLPKQVAQNSKADRIVRRGHFAYNRATTRNGEKISIAYRDGEDCTVSSAYQVFRIVNEEKLLPKFLLLWVSRAEFDRYARYMSKGSAHEFFEYDEMCRVKIPLPPIEDQQAIINLFNCMDSARRIAASARETLRTLCPALVLRGMKA